MSSLTTSNKKYNIYTSTPLPAIFDFQELAQDSDIHPLGPEFLELYSSISGVATCASIPHCPLQPFAPPYLPFELVGVDLFGPLFTSTSQNNWILVAIDPLKRYAETAELSHATASDIAAFLLN